MKQYIVTGMSCAACQARVEKAVNSVAGVTSCSVSLLTNSMGVEGTAETAAVIKAVENAGYGASLKDTTRVKEENSSRYAAEEEALKDHETPALKRRLFLSVGFLCLLMYVSMGHNMWGWKVPSFLEHNHLGLALVQMLLASIVMIINRKFFISGFKGLMHGSPNMDTLVAMGSGVSFAWSVIVLFEMTILITNGVSNMELMPLYHNELYFESAAMILAFITIGKMLEAMSKGKTTDALKSLLQLSPETAVVIRDQQEITVKVEEVQIGEVFIVKPGDSIPVDGIVLEGNSAVNESALTGESIPVDKAPGDKVSAATINQSGYLKCRTTRVGEDTTLSQIIKMVSDAAATKAPIARIADQVSAIFVPAVITIAVLTVIGWLIGGAALSSALARGISVLVISCPCALGLATPVAIMVGNGLGARNGILFKTSESLETTGKVEIVALDKTGTITSGTPVVTDVIAGSADEGELLKLAYALEKKSEHPLARAIVEYGKKQQIPEEDVTEFTIIPGNGLKGIYHGKEVVGGSGKYISQLTTLSEALNQRAEEVSEQGKTPLFFIYDGQVAGMIAVADTIKEDSAEAVAQLKNMGIKVVMLTGDNEKTAAAIGKLAGVDEVIAGVLPDGKEAVIRRLQRQGVTAMVGDGINDAPALTRADIGIAIGAGTDVAIDSADVVLMNSKLTDAASAIRLSRKTLKNIHENLFWAFFYNVVCIPLAMGLLAYKMNPMFGAAAMSLSSFTVCSNALRLNLFNMHDASKDRKLRKKARKQKVYEQKILVEGMMCQHCEATVQNAVRELDGIIEVMADHTTGIVTVESEAEIDRKLIEMKIAEKGYKISDKENQSMKKVIGIEGMMCMHCEAHVKEALEKIEGVVSCKPDKDAKTAEVELSNEVADEVLAKAVTDAGYKVTSVK